jgi:hypothetical protein
MKNERGKLKYRVSGRDVPALSGDVPALYHTPVGIEGILRGICLFK